MPVSIGAIGNLFQELPDTSRNNKRILFLCRMLRINSDPAITYWLQPGPFTDLTDEEFVQGTHVADWQV